MVFASRKHYDHRNKSADHETKVDLEISCEDEPTVSVTSFELAR